MKNKYFLQAFSFSGPVIVLAAMTLSFFLRSGSSAILYFPDFIISSLVHVWLFFRFCEILWAGTSKEGYTLSWREINQPRFMTMFFQWTKQMMFLSICFFLISKIASIPIEIFGCLILGIASSSLCIIFDLIGHCLISASLKVRRFIRGAFIILICATLINWGQYGYSHGLFPSSPGSLIRQIFSINVWWWFFPSVWILDILEGLANGGPFILRLFSIIAGMFMLSGFYIQKKGSPVLFRTGKITSKINIDGRSTK